MTPSRPRLALALAAPAAALVACGSSSSSSGDVGPADASYDATDAGGPCHAVAQQHPIEGYAHVPVCSVVTYDTNPPSSGNHYPVWAAYKTYTTPVPEGFWVHDLEHGAVVLTYNCPTGCAAELAQAQAMIDALPADPLCTSAGGTVTRRVVMTPDPKLDVPFAASAWGWTLRADCFDATAFRAFSIDHYDQGREVTCADGQDVSTGLPGNCGEE